MIMNPKNKLIMKIDFQHADAPSALFDFSAILNKCFYTYISCFLLQFKMYIGWRYLQTVFSYYLRPISYRIRILLTKFSYTLMLLPKHRRTAGIYTSPNSNSHYQSQTHMLYRDLSHKSTLQQYNDIFKAISSNYFEKTSIGEFRCQSPTWKSSTTSLFKNRNEQDLQNNNEKQKESKTIKQRDRAKEKDKFQFQEFDESREINKLLRIAENIEDIRGDKKEEKENKCQVKEQKSNGKIRQSVVKKQKIQFSANQAVFEKLLHAIPYARKTHKFRKETKTTGKLLKQAAKPFDYKFVRIHQKASTNEVRKLKDAVAQLENLAVTKYGMAGFPNKLRNSSVEGDEEDIEPQIEDFIEFENRLKQIRSVESTTIPKSQPEDCSIPVNFMRALSAKKVSYFSRGSNKKPSSIYIRV